MNEQNSALTAAEKDARLAIFSSITPAIVELGNRAFAAGEKVHYAAYTLLETIKANVDNDQLTDAEFREFIRNSTKD